MDAVAEDMADGGIPRLEQNALNRLRSSPVRLMEYAEQILMPAKSDATLAGNCGVFGATGVIVQPRAEYMRSTSLVEEFRHFTLFTLMISFIN